MNFSLLVLNSNNRYVSKLVYSIADFRFHEGTLIIHYSLSKNLFYQEHTASVFLYNKPIAHLLKDSSATACMYVHKSESNQNHRSQEKNQHKCCLNLNFILISYLQLT